MTSPEPPSKTKPEARFFAWMLIVIGALLVVLCGGCTLAIWGVGVFALIEQPGVVGPLSGNEWGALISTFSMTLMVGGVPTAGGAILVWAGWRMLHPLKPPRTVAKTFE